MPRPFRRLGARAFVHALDEHRHRQTRLRSKHLCGFTDVFPDAEAVAVLHRLRREKGVFVDLYAALNVVAAPREARVGGPGRTLAPILCDGGSRYASSLHSPAWLAERGLPLAPG